MTRVNLINPKFLLDQHLMAEYREIPMVPAALNRSLKAKTFPKIPKEYTLNSGHVTFFYNKSSFIKKRYALLQEELINRGFQIDLDRKTNFEVFDRILDKEFIPNQKDITINLERIILRFIEKSSFYKYYGKTKTDYFDFINEKLKTGEIFENFGPN